MSVQTRALVDGADQAAWLDQVLARVLEEAAVPKVHLMGHSFGGWSAANYAARHPRRLASLTLVDPVLVFQGIRWQIYVKSIPASCPYCPAPGATGCSATSAAAGKWTSTTRWPGSSPTGWSTTRTSSRCPNASPTSSCRG